MEEFLKILAGVFGGGLFTSLAFVFGFTNKITSMSGKIDTLKEGQIELKASFNNHISQPPQSCGFHPQQASALVKIETEIVDIDKRIIAVESQTNNRMNRAEDRIAILEKQSV